MGKYIFRWAETCQSVASGGIEDEENMANCSLPGYCLFVLSGVGSLVAMKPARRNGSFGMEDKAWLFLLHLPIRTLIFENNAFMSNI